MIHPKSNDAVQFRDHGDSEGKINNKGSIREMFENEVFAGSKGLHDFNLATSIGQSSMMMFANKQTKKTSGV